MKPWQRGIELDRLQAAVAPFTEHDRGLILGAFTGINEAKVAEWIAERRLVMPQPDLAAACSRLGKPKKVKDFRGVEACTLPEGCLLVERLGYGEEAHGAALGMLRDFAARVPIAVWLWQEHEGDQRIARQLGLRLLAVKIRASSELLGLWGDPGIEPSPLPAKERLGLARLNLPPFDVGPLAEAIETRGLEWAQHYSSYNERGTWQALGLRSFGGDPAFIEKPAEMSRKWKGEHPEALEYSCEDTPLRELLPEAEPIIGAVPGPMERVRLMRLTPAGGLSRHADITDRDAGCSEGRLLRIHVPIVTSSSVGFISWLPDGTREGASMAAGEAWYLDTRKPHAARNDGDGDRVHLVMDTWATPELLSLLPA